MNGCAVCSAVCRSDSTSRRADSMSPSATKVGTRQAIASARISVLPSESPSSRRLGQHLQDLPQRAGAPRPVGAHQHGGEPGPVVDARAPSRSRSARTTAPRSCSPWKSSALASPPSRPIRRGELPSPSAVCRLFEQVDRALLGDSRPPAGLFVADRGAGQQLGVSQLAPDPGRGARTHRARRAPCPPGGSPSRARAGPRPAAGDSRSAARARCASTPPPARSRARRSRRAPPAASTRPPRPASASGPALEKWWARSARARAVALLARLERLADPEVELGPPQGAEPVIERAAHQLVGEAIGERARGELLDHAAARGLLERDAKLAVGELRRPADRAELELGAGDRGQLEQVGGAGGKPGEPLADDLPHTLRGCPAR